MKISILLPYKENYSPIYPGAVSIFINSVTKYSKYKNNIKIYGNTKLKKNIQQIIKIFLWKKNICKVQLKFI